MQFLGFRADGNHIHLSAHILCDDSALQSDVSRDADGLFVKKLPIHIDEQLSNRAVRFVRPFQTIVILVLLPPTFLASRSIFSTMVSYILCHKAPSNKDKGHLFFVRDDASQIIGGFHHALYNPGTSAKFHFRRIPQNQLRHP